MKENTMFTAQRFFVDQNDDIIDKLNLTAEVVRWLRNEEPPKDEMRLREAVLCGRLRKLVGDLLINTNPMQRLPDGTEYQPHCEERLALLRAVGSAITASHLNTLDIAVSSRRSAGGELPTKKRGMQDFTSLSLFADDVERLLRDLYGDSDSEAIDRIRRAVFEITEVFTEYLRKDLCEEHQNARMIDYVCGIGVPEGYGISGSDHKCANKAEYDLAVRIRAGHSNPTAFSKYTIEFVKVLDEQWTLRTVEEFEQLNNPGPESNAHRMAVEA
jgi:hypothetical protein